MLAGLTFAVDQRVDPSAVASASRRPGEPWFCFEQPDRDGAALGALGCVRAIRAAGVDRFAAVAAAWRRLADGAEADAPDGPSGAGLVAVGGFAFAPEGGTARHWDGFAAAELIVPEVGTTDPQLLALRSIYDSDGGDPQVFRALIDSWRQDVQAEANDVFTGIRDDLAAIRQDLNLI